MTEEKKSTISDKIGITSAVLCTIHCLAIPVLFLAKSWYSSSAMAHLPGWWESVDYIFLVISFVAVYHSAAHSGARDIKLALWISWAVLAIAILYESALHWLAYFASAGLITAHLINISRIHKSLYRVK